MKLSKFSCLFALLIVTGCASRQERLKDEWNDHKSDLDKLKLELKKKSDSFQSNRALAEDSAFRKRVEWLTNDIHATEVKMDTIEAKLKRMNPTRNEEQEEEHEREAG